MQRSGAIVLQAQRVKHMLHKSLATYKLLATLCIIQAGARLAHVGMCSGCSLSEGGGKEEKARARATSKGLAACDGKGENEQGV